MQYRILVVDDSAIVTKVVSEMLDRAGYVVESVNSALVATSRMVEFKPHIILLDLNMPGLAGENIIDMVAKRNFSFDYRVVIHSSESDERLNAASERPGVIGCIKKGRPDDNFLRSFERFVRQYRSECSVNGVPDGAGADAASEPLGITS